MNYKSFYVQNHENAIQDFSSNIKLLIYKPLVLDFRSNEYDFDQKVEIDYNQRDEYIKNTISQAYDSMQDDIKYMFDFESPSLINQVLEYLFIAFASNKKPTIEEIMNFHYFEFIFWVIYQKDNVKINTNQAIDALIYLFRYQSNDINQVILNSIDCIADLMSSKNLSIVDLSLKFLKELFIYNSDYALTILRTKDLIQKILNIPQIDRSAIASSSAIDLISTILFFAKQNEEIAYFVPPQLIEFIVVRTLQFITKFRPNVTESALTLFQIISSDVLMLSVALRKGLGTNIIKALGDLPNDQMSSIYIIIRNITEFSRAGQVKSKITDSETFFKKTALLIKSNVDIETFNSIITTIDLLGIDFWIQFLKYGVIDSLISIIKASNYDTKKIICSILLNIFKDVNLLFRRDFCNEQILKLFFDMLDDDDTDFCIELIDNLSSILHNDIDFFLPFYVNFGYDQYLISLADSENPQLAELAQAQLNSLPVLNNEE